MVNVAFLITEVRDLSGAGGAERFFYDFYKRNNHDKDRKTNIYFYTDNETNLENVSYKNNNKTNFVRFKSYRNKFFKAKTDKLKYISVISDFIRNLITFFPIYYSLIKHNIQVLHVPLYELKDYRLIWMIDKLTIFKRPKISLSIVDCRIPYRYFSKENSHYYSSYITYHDLFTHIRIDGFFSWYELFKQFAIDHNLIKNKGLIYCVKSRYSIVDIEQCLHKKENIIVFAGRLDDQKDPMFFLKAIHKLVEQKKTENYKFKIFGRGPLQADLENYIKHNNLHKVVTIGFNPKMKDEFIKSKCYVSTQLYENFPSMSMAEAMACQNVIIAKNVGQTQLFVKNEHNGYLCQPDDVNDLVNKLTKFLSLSENEKSVMGNNSLLLMTQVHTYENFRRQFDEYIFELLKQK